MRRSTAAQWLTRLKLQLCLFALPGWVWPREYVYSWWRKVMGQDQPSMTHLLANASIRWLSTTLSIEQFNTVTSTSPSIPSTIRSCRQLEQLGVSSEKESITGTNFHATMVVAVPESTHLILYVHGGGFVSGSSIGNSRYLLQLFLEMQHQGLVCNILSVDYDLSPEARYPTALQQVAHAYWYATSLGKPIILMGDSAGGNLCLGLLQHLATPNPLMESLSSSNPEMYDNINNRDSAVITAVCLLSPWVNLQTRGPSVKAFEDFDCLDKTLLDTWAQHYMGPHGKLDCYASPAERRKDWASILPAKTLFVVGGMELFLSDIVDMADNIRKDGFENLTLCIMPYKGHAWPAVDFGFGCATRPLGVNSMKAESALAGLKLQANWIVSAARG